MLASTKKLDKMTFFMLPEKISSENERLFWFEEAGRDFTVRGNHSSCLGRFEEVCDGDVVVVVVAVVVEDDDDDDDEKDDEEDAAFSFFDVGSSPRYSTSSSAAAAAATTALLHISHVVNSSWFSKVHERQVQ